MTPNPRASVFTALPSTTGVLARRVIAYLLDLGFIVLFWALAASAAVFLTILSFGLLYWLLPLVALTPLAYWTLMVGGRHGATWGMRLMSVGYRRDIDGGMPSYLEGFVASVVFHFTVWPTGGLILIIALLNDRHRTLHDMISGLVMIRTDDTVWAV